MATFHENLIQTFNNFKNKYITPINNSLEKKVDHFTSGNYKPVTGIAYDETTKKLGLKVDGADTVIPFNKGARLVGTYSSNTTVNVASYGATSASQFIAVVTASGGSWNSGYIEGFPSHGYYKIWSTVTMPSLRLSGNNLTITVGTNNFGTSGIANHNETVNNTVKVYFVG